MTLVLLIGFLGLVAASVAETEDNNICDPRFHTTEYTVRVPNRDNCRGYYECDAGKMTAHKCSETEHFHKFLKKCVPATRFPCGNKAAFS